MFKTTKILSDFKYKDLFVKYLVQKETKIRLTKKQETSFKKYLEKLKKKNYRISRKKKKLLAKIQG